MLLSCQTFPVQWQLKKQLLKVLKENNVDIGTYHGGCIIDNLCMYMASNVNNIMQAMIKSMCSKIKDAANRKHLNDICD